MCVCVLFYRPHCIFNCHLPFWIISMLATHPKGKKYRIKRNGEKIQHIKHQTESVKLNKLLLFRWINWLHQQHQHHFSYTFIYCLFSYSGRFMRPFYTVDFLMWRIHKIVRYLFVSLSSQIWFYRIGVPISKSISMISVFESMRGGIHFTFSLKIISHCIHSLFLHKCFFVIFAIKYCTQFFPKSKTYYYFVCVINETEKKTLYLLCVAFSCPFLSLISKRLHLTLCMNWCKTKINKKKPTES